MNSELEKVGEAFVASFQPFSQRYVPVSGSCPIVCYTVNTFPSLVLFHTYNFCQSSSHSQCPSVLASLFPGYTGLFISPSGTSELDCATTKKDRAERSISIGRESLKVFFVLGALAYLQVPPLGGSRDEKWRAQ